MVDTKRRWFWIAIVASAVALALGGCDGDPPSQAGPLDASDADHGADVDPDSGSDPDAELDAAVDAADADARRDAADSDGGAPPQDTDPGPDAGPFSYPTDEYAGRVDVTLHPQAAASSGGETAVVFAIPFPKGWLTDAGSVSLHDGDDEVAIDTVVVGQWHDPAGGSPSSIRSVRVSLRHTFADADPVTLEMRWGGPRQAELGAPIDVVDTWAPIDASGVDEAEYSTTEILEPTVYATLPPEWLSISELRTRTRPVGDWTESGWFDQALQGYSHTMVNDVPDAVSEEDLVNYEPDTWEDTGSLDTGSWLFDRASALWGVYFRTGEVKWLRHAHRASQYYALNIERDNASNPADSQNANIRGQFRFKDVNYGDHKYSYGLPMLLDRLVVGAAKQGPAEAEDAVRAVSDAISDSYWEQTYGSAGAYDPSKGANHIWTERHQAYAFAAHLTAWEYTGEAAYRDKLDAYVEQMADHITDPPGDYPADGCLVHDFKHHEWNRYDDALTPVCSPWMTALLAEPLWRYYRLSEDQRALEILADIAESVAEHGTYIAQDESGDVSEGSELWDARLPQYLYSSQYSATSEGVAGPWQDWEHTCDVATLVLRGVVAGELLGRDMASEQTVADELLESCQTVLAKWHRPGDDEYMSRNGPEWRLTPARKYNWWFGTTHDLPWLKTLVDAE